ncbi:MAG: rod shape-determining protein RodA [Candidatus Daviesbacteria bacterium]|nr:rod shape-determining protein RodA [Candidatus Daviesbacteria bacterium]
MKNLQIKNWPITIISFLLFSVGILVIYSSSPELALQQSFFAIVGFLIFVFIAQFDYRSIKNLVTPIYFLTIILLVVVFVLGIETRGSIRWIPLGPFNMQPSEFAKPALILFLAHFWTRNVSSWKSILTSLILFLPISFLVFKQPDLGSTMTITAIWIGILFSSGISTKKLVTLVIIGVLFIPVSWFLLHDYQKERITSFFAPETDPLGRGYNLIQSTIAVGSGELLGRGLGRGTQSRLQFLPEFRTDFIFASIAEELGFIGALLILILYLILLFYLLWVAKEAYDFFGFLLISGVVSMISFQTVVNIGMNIGLLPITGITLPLISYGGSSLIATFICLGLAASVIKYKKRIDMELKED